MKKISVLSLIVLLGAGIAFGQAIAGLGAITGVVRDSAGLTVPAAEVTVANESRGIRRVLTTNDAGVFTAPALAPAPGYQVTVKVAGFATYDAKDLQLQVGQTMNLNVVLQVAQAATQVEVTGQAPLVEDTKTDVSQVVNQLQIQELPINGRRVDSFVLLTPGVSNDGFYGQITFRGTNANNSFLTDGNDTTNSFFNENAGRTRISSQISQDAVQEFQVLSTSFTAEFGRASGGVVNTVTKSGSNDIHGTGYWFFRNQDFNARDRYATTNPAESRHQGGGSVGGAIKKDKLFYFFNGEVTRRDFPGVSSIVKPGVIDSSTNWIGCGAPATADQCAAANGILKRFAGTIPRTVSQDLLFGKIDWRPNDRNSISASFNYVRWVSPNGIQTGASYNTGALLGSNGTTTVRDRYGRLSWTAVPSNTMVNEARFGWFKDRQADDLTQSSIPSFGPVTLTVAGVSNLGIASYLPRVNPSENRFQYADTLSWTVGRHAMKFGMDVTNTEDYVYNLSNQYGTYSYNTITAFAQDLTGNTAGKKGYSSFSQGLGNPKLDFTTRDWSFFAQDQFRLTAKLTLNYGLRYEYSQLPQPTISNPDYPQTARIPGRNTNFAPRFGLAYGINDKTVVRGGYGIYYARYPGGVLGTLLQQNAKYQSSIYFSSTSDITNKGPIFPNRLPVDYSGTGASSIYFADPNFRSPYAQQGDVAIERALTDSLGLTVSYLWTRGLQLFTNRDLNIGQATGSYTFPIQDTSGSTVGSFTTPGYLLANRVDTRYQRIYQMENGGQTWYNGLAVQLNKRFAKGFQSSVAYTWSHAIDENQSSATDSATVFQSYGVQSLYNGDYSRDKGSSVLDQRHRLVWSFVAAPTFTKKTDAFSRFVVNNWQLSGITTLASARPTSATIRMVDSRPFTGSAFNTTLNGLGANTRVPFWPINSQDIDQAYRLDARLSKIVPISDRYRLALNFEAFNVTNTPSNTGIRTEAYTLTGGVLKPSAGFTDGNSSAGYPDGTNVRRLQVSARFTF